MGLPRVFVKRTGEDVVYGDDITLSDSQSHHLKNVLRLGLTDRVAIVFEETGDEFEAKISILNIPITLKRCSPITNQRTKQSSHVDCLLFALCKGDRNEFIVDSATQLGVSRIIAFQAERSVVVLKSADDETKKLTRFMATAEGAASQSQRSSIPEIFVARSLETAFSFSKSGQHTNVVCSLSEKAQPLYRSPLQGATKICVAVGPEGDFTQKEYDFFNQNNFLEISLGSQVLRSELACVSAIVGVDTVLRAYRNVEL